jgi:hypothetical protein
VHPNHVFREFFVYRVILELLDMHIPELACLSIDVCSIDVVLHGESTHTHLSHVHSH